jgi:imidazoleglycerol-phosphate dehydratase/histidinol-phosphatase
MKKVLFIDRDGTIIREPEDEQVDSLEKLAFLPGVITRLGLIAREMDYELVMVTNQDGLGTSSFPEETFRPAHQMMLDVFKGEGIQFSEILIDRSFPEDNLPTRKPGTAMLGKYLSSDYDLANSFVIGDRNSDVELASNLGCKAIRIVSTNGHKENKSESYDGQAFLVSGWKEIYDLLKNTDRTATVKRTTSETNIDISLNLDGQGKSKVDTGLGFFDHMLDQLARHAGVDLSISVEGDLNVDEHHTIEDTGIALGKAFDRALGSRKNISRYGFLLPMDDALAQVAIDFGGRPWLVWEAEFKREMIGDMPTEMFSHFFKSFSDAARCNLNIKAEAENEHHKIESIFKAWARALKMAIKQTNDGLMPTTKGVL